MKSSLMILCCSLFASVTFATSLMASQLQYVAPSQNLISDPFAGRTDSEGSNGPSLNFMPSAISQGGSRNTPQGGVTSIPPQTGDSMNLPQGGVSNNAPTNGEVKNPSGTAGSQSGNGQVAPPAPQKNPNGSGELQIPKAPVSALTILARSGLLSTSVPSGQGTGNGNAAKSNANPAGVLQQGDVAVMLTPVGGIAGLSPLVTSVLLNFTLMEPSGVGGNLKNVLVLQLPKEFSPSFDYEGQTYTLAFESSVVPLPREYRDALGLAEGTLGRVTDKNGDGAVSSADKNAQQNPANGGSDQAQAVNSGNDLLPQQGNGNGNASDLPGNNPAPTPEPSAAMLVGLGLIALLGVARRRM